MRAKLQAIIWLCLVLLVTACGQKNSGDVAITQSAALAPMSTPSAKMTETRMLGAAEQRMNEVSEPDAAAITNPTKKYIALRHHLNIELPAENLQASFEATIKHCESLNCQILNANFNKETPYNPPSASLSVRIPPRNVAIFLAGLAKSGDILQHGREAEDKTNQAVDADARIKNLTELRDRLRGMLADKSAKFKGLIEVERELANTQSELDSIVSMRKILSLETDLVAVNIDFSAKQGIAQQGFFAPVLRAFKEAGNVMMESFASVILFVMNAIPWLLIGIPLIFAVRKLWAWAKVWAWVKK